MLSIKESLTLQHLVSYHALTNSHLVHLGIGKTTDKVNEKYVTPLREKKLLKSQSFGSIPGKGKLEYFHYLSEKGVRTVAEILRCEPSEIYYPRYGLKFKDDYFHRKMFINFHIYLRQWVDKKERRELEFFNPYYQKTKDNKSISINQFVFKKDFHLPLNYPISAEPDGIFRFSKKGTEPILCLVEIHNKPDTKSIIRQLGRNITASLNQKIVSERFQYPYDPIILSVHQGTKSLKSVKKRLLEMPDYREKISPALLFGLINELQEDFTNSWVTADGQVSKLFL